MTAFSRTACLPLALLLCSLVLMSGAARAQGLSNRVTGPVTSGTPKVNSAVPQPPPALPGTTLNRDRTVPAEKTDQDLPPTDALFDAITRGDMAAARDALNRGADLNAHDVLGLTPIDLSVDLARNDITFLLLSLRGSQPSASGPRQPVLAGKSTPGKPTPAPKASVLQQTVSRAAPRQIVEAAPERPAVGDPGTPNPQFGFLGFGG